MLWRGRGGKRAEVQHDDVLLFRVDLGQHRRQVRKRVIVAGGNQHIAGPATEGFRRETGFGSQLELINISLPGAAPSRESFRNGKDSKQKDGECYARDGSHLFGEKIRNCDPK